MEHSDVVRLQAVEKYVLGELPADLRDQFEEHYFDCGKCAEDLNSLTTFVTASRIVLAETPAANPVPSAGRSAKGGWPGWLRPIIAVPAMAALAAVVIFQNSVTIPALKQSSSTESGAEVYSSSYHLQGAVRGENPSRISAHLNESFALDFDFTPAVPYQSYMGNLIDERGNTVLSFRVNVDLANKEIHVVVPRDRVRPGNYDLVFVGEGRSLNQSTGSTEVQRLAFVVEGRP